MRLLGIFGFALFGFFAATSLVEAQHGAKRAYTDIEQVDDDFALQGEYEGITYTGKYGQEAAGLQVVALGDGKFSAVQYRLGLPGAGWNTDQRVKLEGSRDGDSLRLGDDNYRVTIRDGVALLENQHGTVGRLCKVGRVSPTMGLQAPASATVLFDGTSVDGFKDAKMTESGLLIEGAETKHLFGDFRMHVEFRTPYMPTARGQGRGNSGVYIQRRYEVQVLDSFGLDGVHNECGGLYKQKAPNVNMALPPLSWQTYDILFTAARFDEEGKKSADAQLTVVHNGVKIHDNYSLKNKTGAGRQETPEPGPIWFQNHSDPVRFRNIWFIDNPDSTDIDTDCDACDTNGRRFRRRR